MTAYVKIRRLNGRNDHLLLATWLTQSGVNKVEYADGGWQDTRMDVTQPHLRFENAEDAVAYVLAHGGEVLRDVPVTCSLYK